MVVERFDVFLVSLDPCLGSEIKKTRPCLMVSPDEMNRHIARVIVAPMAAEEQAYPSRIAWEFEGKAGQIVLDQLRTVDKRRLVRRLGQIDEPTQRTVIAKLVEMFGD